MKKAVIILLIAAFAGYSKVGIIINKDVIKIPHVKSAVDTYIFDLLATGEQVWVDSTTFDDGNTRLELQQLRDSLRTQHFSNDLTGAVLIGNLPTASFEVWSKKYIYDEAWNVIDSFWEGENYPVDYYFMDLTDQYDTAWHDSLDETTELTDPNYPYFSGYFDNYTGDNTLEIWVSRIFAHNLYHTYVSSDGSFENPFAEDSVITAYLQRVHERMTVPATTARRAMLMGDFKNWFPEDQPHIENLNIPLSTFRFPHDAPRIWQRELRKGYEWACIYEHSHPQGHNMAMDHNENTGSFFSFSHEWFGQNDRSFLQMTDSSTAPPKVLFYQDYGCSNVNYNFDDCLGQMYAMLQNGLICMGSSKIYYPKDHAEYTDSLGNGGSFGQAFLYYLNSKKYNPNYQSLALIGAGTLKLQPYIPADLPSIIIDSIWLEATDASPYLIHGDTLILHAKTSSSIGAIDTNLIDFNWYGVSDSVSGNHVSFILDGHNAPTYSNGTNQGTYTIILHAECPGYLPAVKTIEFAGWHFKEIYSNFHSFDALNRHEKSAEGWDLRIRGRTGNIGSTEDDFLFYCRPLNDNSFKVTAMPKALENMTSASAKTGVMIRRSHFSPDDPHVFLGVQSNNILVFQYRLTQGGTTTTHSFAGYYIGDTWVALKKIFDKVYGFVSTDGINYTLVDSVEISVFNNPSVGFAYSCNDTSMWTGTDERWAVFGKMDIAVIDTIEPLPVVYASDSIVTLDRVQLNAVSIGAGVHFSSNMDCLFNGSIKVNGNAVFRDGSVVNGTMKLAGYLSLLNGATHNGELHEGTSVEFGTIPVKTVPVGTYSVYVGNDKTRTLSGGGTYKDITVESRGHLILNPGVYNMRSFILNPDAKLTVNGPVEINVNSNLSFDDRVILTVSSINNIKIYTNDPVFSIGEMVFKGHVLAPHARITLKSRINYRGSIKGKVLFFDNDAKLYDY